MSEETVPVARPNGGGGLTLQAEPPRVGLTPMDLIARVIEKDGDISKIEKLMELNERHEQNEARKAFEAAKADAKAKIKPIIRNRDGHNSKKYADLAALADAVDVILADHGLNYSWRSRQDERIHVTCVLSHRLGHSEEATLSGPPDKTGNKNDVQAIGSTAKYLMRYTLEQVLGLATKEHDDDGRATSGDTAPISEVQLKELRDLLDETGSDIAGFCEYLRVESLADLPQSKLESAKRTIKAAAAAKAKRKPTEKAA